MFSSKLLLKFLVLSNISNQNYAFYSKYITFI